MKNFRWHRITAFVFVLLGVAFEWAWSAFCEGRQVWSEHYKDR